MIIYADDWYKTLQKTWAYGRNLVGYCHYHKKFVTRKQADLHGCFRKKCRRFERIQ